MPVGKRLVWLWMKAFKPSLCHTGGSFRSSGASSTHRPPKVYLWTLRWVKAFVRSSSPARNTGDETVTLNWRVCCVQWHSAASLIPADERSVKSACSMNFLWTSVMSRHRTGAFLLLRPHEDRLTILERHTRTHGHDEDELGAGTDLPKVQRYCGRHRELRRRRPLLLMATTRQS